MAVVGGSDSAAKEALELAQLAAKVYIIYRGEMIHPEPINGARIAAHPNIEVIAQTNIVEMRGDDRVRLALLDPPYHGSPEFALDGIFVAIGQIPQSGIAKKLGVSLNEKEEIIINRYAETNLHGVYAAGDVADTEFKQMITGCAEGVMAAYKAFNYIARKKAA